MVVTMVNVGHTVELHGHQVNGVIPSPGMVVVINPVPLPMTVNVHIKHVLAHVLYEIEHFAYVIFVFYCRQ